MAPPFKLTEDGFETQWQTNFLAGHLLFISLLPLLQSNAASSTNKSRVRVVNVSGEAAFVMGPKEFTPNDPNLASLQGTMAPL
jgi:NAD(P)-dependent dehydrogenase (short-subunit alcohol dehydrogenase family)